MTGNLSKSTPHFLQFFFQFVYVIDTLEKSFLFHSYIHNMYAKSTFCYCCWYQWPPHMSWWSWWRVYFWWIPPFVPFALSSSFWRDCYWKSGFSRTFQTNSISVTNEFLLLPIVLCTKALKLFASFCLGSKAIIPTIPPYPNITDSKWNSYFLK